MTVPEGLRGFKVPCARVLSVAGLLAFNGLFPGCERFIPEVRMPGFLPVYPFSFNNPGITVIPARVHLAV